MESAPPHGQQSVVHGEGITLTVAGLDEEEGDGEADERAGGRGQLDMAAQTPPGRVHVQGHPLTPQVGIQLVHTLGAWAGGDGDRLRSNRPLHTRGRITFVSVAHYSLTNIIVIFILRMRHVKLRMCSSQEGNLPAAVDE